MDFSFLIPMFGEDETIFDLRIFKKNNGLVQPSPSLPRGYLTN